MLGLKLLRGNVSDFEGSLTIKTDWYKKTNKKKQTIMSQILTAEKIRICVRKELESQYTM